MTDDLIRRRAACDLLVRALKHNYEPGYAVCLMDNLPSAEPQRKKGSCAECKQIKDLCVACKRNVNIKDYFIGW